MAMYITDLNGQRKEITDLDAALEFAEWAKDCYHENPQGKAISKGDIERQKYWHYEWCQLKQLKESK